MPFIVALPFRLNKHQSIDLSPQQLVSVIGNILDRGNSDLGDLGLRGRADNKPARCGPQRVKRRYLIGRGVRVRDSSTRVGSGILKERKQTGRKVRFLMQRKCDRNHRYTRIWIRHAIEVKSIHGYEQRSR